MLLDPYKNAEGDLDADPDWQQQLIDVAHYREEAERFGLPTDPLWDEWETEALLALGAPVRRSLDPHLVDIRHSKHNQKDHGKKKGGGKDSDAKFEKWAKKMNRKMSKGTVTTQEALARAFGSGKMSKKQLKKAMKADTRDTPKGLLKMDKEMAKVFAGLEWRSTGGSSDGRDRGDLGVAEAVGADDRGGLGRPRRQVRE